MKTAIIGSGISGLAAASHLHFQGHNITVYEANNYIGGHVKTIRIPIESLTNNIEPFPVEMGVFMHDPKYIHPLMNANAKELGIKIREIPLTFSFQNLKYNLSWTTKSRFSGILRNLSVFYSIIKKTIFKGNFNQNVFFFMELQRFLRNMPRICLDDQFCQMSLYDFIRKEQYSDCFLDNWLLPQMMCWWGITRKNAMLINIQIIVQSMFFVSSAPQYIFEGGWDRYLEKIYSPFLHSIRTNSYVNRVLRKNQKVEVTSNNLTEIYDNLIFAIPPSAITKILQHKNPEEERILNSFTTITTRVYLHRDDSWMPTNQEWSTINLIQDTRGDFCTLYFGGLDLRKPLLLVTWGDKLNESPDPSKIITTTDWLRTLPTVEYTKASHSIHSLQGKDHIWHCGAHVDALDPTNQKSIPSLWHENSYRSGLYVADLIHRAKIKQEENE
ncbi:MAG: FAD-dependent oxidoreductase [Parachlamydiaceae bacterium]|nr:FAD-dependent oxidoreductase [Parachlamydiaceae bacterium]